MQVMKKTLTKHSLDTVHTYTLSNGYTANVWGSGMKTVYTPKGNFASQITSIKVVSAIREYEIRQKEGVL